MKSLYLAIFLTFFAMGCGKQYVTLTEIKAIDKPDKNSCLVDAAMFQAVYNQYNRMKPFYFTKILLIKWSKKENEEINGHAACVFVLNTSKDNNPLKNKLFVYDYANGSRIAPMFYLDKPEILAKIMYPNIKVIYANYLY